MIMFIRGISEMKDIEIFKNIWLENNWTTSNNMVSDLLDSEISSITYTAEHGDKYIEITSSDNEFEKLCYILKYYKIIESDQADFIIENQIDIISLY
jgi:hypothetical protein